MRKIYLSVMVMMAFNFMVAGQVNFIEVTNLEEMEAAKQKASDHQLMMFVDVYATWCGPCKMMDREVYTDPAVADYMNSNFVSVRMDGETDYGRVYVAEQKLEGYPSMFIFSRDGESVSKVVGFTPAEELVTSLKGTVENYKVVRGYNTKYKKGILENDEFEKYVSTVREMGNHEEAEKLASEYIARIIDPNLSDNDIRVVAYYMDLESSWWDEFSSDPERLKKVLGDNYMLVMEKIYNNSLVKAVDKDNIVLISKMANELVSLVEGEATSSWDLRTLPFIQYYYYTNQAEELIAYIDRRFATDRQGDHRWLYGAASEITDMDQQYLTQALLEKGVEWFQICIDMEENFDYFFYHGMALFFLEQQEEAKGSFLKAESFAASDEQQTMITQVLEFVNNQ